MSLLRTTMLTAAGLLAALAAAGCTDIGGLTITAEDRIAQPGQTVRVMVDVHRKGLSRWFGPRIAPAVRIYRDNELLDESRPELGVNGIAVDVIVETPGEHVIDAIYQARHDYKPQQATCYAYCWDASKVAIAVDFDQVVNQVGRFDKYVDDLPLGEPRDEAAAVLSALAREFYICYLTDLGPEVKSDMRAWMRKNNFPSGPIFTWDRGNRYRLAGGNQSATLARLREQVPTLLIGIGGGGDDLDAFAANKILPLMIEFAGPVRGPANVPRCLSWRDAWQFFTLDANHPILTDPKTMLDLHYRGGQYVGLGNQQSGQ